MNRTYTASYWLLVHRLKEWYRAPRYGPFTTQLTTRRDSRGLSVTEWQMLELIELRIIDGRIRRGIPYGAPLGKGNPANVG